MCYRKCLDYACFLFYFFELIEQPRIIRNVKGKKHLLYPLGTMAMLRVQIQLRYSKFNFACFNVYRVAILALFCSICLFLVSIALFLDKNE